VSAPNQFPRINGYSCHGRAMAQSGSGSHRPICDISTSMSTQRKFEVGRKTTRTENARDFGGAEYSGTEPAHD
jgi:hypothetical protein